LASNELGLPRSDSPPTAEEIIFGHQQVIARARAQGLKIYGATLTPFEETAIPVVPNYWTAGGDATRQAVNAWLRSGQGYDEIIDFDVVMRSPEAPTRFLPEYDSGDHLHPGDTGYVAMAEAVDLELLKVDTR
jgi:lysophospholipase L1-like esterase